MFKLFYFILLSFLTYGHGSLEAVGAPQATIEAISLESQAEFYHSQDRKLLGSSIKDSILQAKDSVLIFTFSLSDPGVIEALNKKASEGLPVTVVIDKEHLAEIKSKGAPGIEIITRTTGEGHLHHKILVIDGREIWIGSANFTTSAYETQENLMVTFVSPELGHYLHNEADVFRGQSVRTEHGPVLVPLLNQDIYFCHLPHDGFPPKQIEKAINDLSKKLLIEKINGAHSTIRIAMMVWTNNDLTNAVIQAHRRGVLVQVVTPDFGGNIPKIMSAGIEVKVNPKLTFMHNKLMWIDDTILVNGSANWSQSSFTRSDESFIILEPMTEDQFEKLKLYWNYLFD